eukprot:COSAG02_NODE_52054_length_310_cov_0.796209_1_plen_98_part_01
MGWISAYHDDLLQDSWGATTCRRCVRERHQYNTTTLQRERAQFLSVRLPTEPVRVTASHALPPLSPTSVWQGVHQIVCPPPRSLLFLQWWRRTVPTRS